jgi:MoaD family protein
LERTGLALSKFKIRLYTALQAMAGQSEVEVEAESIGEALEYLSQKYGKDFHDSLFDKEGRILYFYRVYMNKENIPLSEAPRKKPRDGDVVHIFPPVIGGSL